MSRQLKCRPTLEALETRLCLSTADLLPAVSALAPEVQESALGDGSVRFVSDGITMATYSGDTAPENFLNNDAASAGGWGSSMYQYAWDIPVSPAHVDYFIKLKGFDGEATADRSSATGPKYFDGRFLTACDLKRDQVAGDAGDEWLSAVGQDAADASPLPVLMVLADQRDF